MEKKKARQFTNEEKLKFIEKVDANPHMKRVQIARMLDIPTTTLNTIVSNRNKIEDACVAGGSSQMKRVRKSQFPALEDVLVNWFKQARASNIPVDGTLIQAKASHLAAKMGFRNFKASNGWLEGFKKRNKLSYKSVRGEAASVNIDTVQTWRDTTLPEVLKDYSPDDVFNADEAGLFFQLLPDKTYAFKGEKCHGGKLSKERLTVLLCCNESGTEKLTPLVIGKWKNPRCFKNVRTFPCQYTANTNAWMTSSIFENFLRSLDARMGVRQRKIVLFIDRCAAHPVDTSYLRNVRVVFLPANCTSHLQPLDQGIIRCVKQKYRKILVQKRLAFLETASRKITILDAMHFVKSAWTSVNETTVRNCFRKAGFVRSATDEVSTEIMEITDDLDEECDQLGTDEEDVNFAAYVVCDDNVATCEVQTVDEIHQQLMIDKDSNEQEPEDENETEEIAVPTHSAAIEAMDIVRRYVSSFAVDDSVMDCVTKLDTVVCNLKQKKKQSTLDMFLTRK